MAIMDCFEDRDSDESLVRTKIHWNDGMRESASRAAVGDLGSLPQQRTVASSLARTSRAELIELGTFLPAQWLNSWVTREAMSERQAYARWIFDTRPL